MKFIRTFLIILFIPLTFILLSCRLSTSELADQVKKNIYETYKEKGLNDLTINSFMLTHKEGNEYSGILETKDGYNTFKYEVEVLYDGETIKWEIKKAYN